MDQYVEEYLNLIRDTVDKEADIDRNGNVVYVQQDSPYMIRVVTTTPEDCRKFITDLYGGYNADEN